MGLEKRKATIDGFEYEVTTLDAFAAIPVFDKVVKVLAPIFEDMGKSDAAITALATAATTEIDPVVLARLVVRALATGTRHTNPVDLRYCIDAFAKATAVQVNAQQQPQLERVFAAHFAGNLTSMWKWFYFCLEVNFADFLDAARAMMARAKPAPSGKGDGASPDADTQTSASPITSTGDSIA